MLTEYQALPLEDNRAESRFELQLDGGFAFMDYQDKGDLFYLLHTEVPQDFEGKGAASALAEKVFVFLRERGVKVKIYCGYLVTWLKRHPEFADMVA